MIEWKKKNQEESLVIEVIYVDQEQQLVIGNTVLSQTHSMTKSRFQELLSKIGIVFDDTHISQLNRKRVTKKNFLELLANQGIIKLIIVDFNLEYKGDKIETVKARCIRQDEPNYMDPAYKKGIIYTLFVDINGKLTFNDENGNTNTVATIENRDWANDDYFPKYFEIV
jgi:hypothetical protein